MQNLAKVDQPALRIVSRPILERDLLEFDIDRRARNLTPKTLKWYSQSLAVFSDYARQEGISDTLDITPGILRRFVLHLQERGHNAGGVKNIFGAVKAFLKWYQDENNPRDWVNPVSKVKMPKTPDEPLEPVAMDDLQKMLGQCVTTTLIGARDYAALLVLLDTGIRHAEMIDLDIGDLDLSAGTILVRCGKGRKPRSVFIGATTKKALVRYLKRRGNLADSAPLWSTEQETRLTYDGLRQMVRRRAEQAGVPEPSLHSFRRAFAIAALRNGCDLVSLQRMLGHSGLQVVSRYLRQVQGDLAQVHAKAGPVDNLLGNKRR